MTANDSYKLRPSTWMVVAATVFATLLISGTGAYLSGYLNSGKTQAASQGPVKTSEREIAFWQAPMNPTEIYDKPGKSAMGMDLVPVYEDELIGGVQVSVDPVIQQNMGIRTKRVVREPLIRTIRTYGQITADETRITRISVKTDGWIEKLYIDFTGKYIKKGDPLFTIYSPKLLTAQKELLIAKQSNKRLGSVTGQNLLSAARQRLSYFDVADTEIEKILASGKTQKSILIRSPASGYVIDKNIEEGGFVKTGKTLSRIADLSRIWVDVHIYDYELPWIKQGQKAVMQLSYHPGRKFVGHIAYIYPYLQPKTRDVVIRLEFDNKDLSLKPNMFADVVIKSRMESKGLTIPSEAVIRTGERDMVFVVRPNNKFAPTDITLGPSLENGKVQVLTGLALGDVVVTSGQFLLDSESKLKEAIQKMMEAKSEKAHPSKPMDKMDETKDSFFDDMK